MKDNFNIGAKYEIVGRISQGQTIVAYKVRDRETGEIDSIEKGIVEQLALNKQVYNCKAQLYNNLVNLKGIGCKLSDLPKYDKEDRLLVVTHKQVKAKASPEYKLVARQTDGHAICGYVAIRVSNIKVDKEEPVGLQVDTPSGKLYILSRDEAYDLAKDKKIENVRAQTYGDNKILRGAKGLNIAKLPLYKG